MTVPSRDSELWQSVQATLDRVNTQGQAIIGLEANQKAINDNMKTMADNLSVLAERIGSATQTKWDNIWQAAAVALTIGGFFWYLMSANIEQVYERVAGHTLDGHPNRVVALIERTQAEVEDIKDYVLRMVPRAEHDVHWTYEERNIEGIRKRLDRLESKTWR